MKHRAVRLILLLLAVAAAGGAAYSVVTLEQRAAADRAQQQAIRDQAASVLALIADLRASQRGYIAAGQGHQFWTARVTDVLVELNGRVRKLRASLRSEAGIVAVDSALVALENFIKVDARAQEYVSLDQPFLASDLVFSDGLELTAAASGDVETVLRQEIQARDQGLGTMRQRQAWTAGGGGTMLILVIALLVPIPRAVGMAMEESPADQETTTGPLSLEDARPGSSGDLQQLPDLAGAARLCTEFGRVMETKEVLPLLERAAGILDANGLVVWVSDRSGVELRPALTHGYSENVVAQMRGIPRDAQNAAALAFRTAEPRVVASTDLSNGAFVVPLMTPAGCVGVFAAELRHGGEQRESTRAVATILAAQMATLLAAAPSTGTAQAHG